MYFINWYVISRMIILSYYSQFSYGIGSRYDSLARAEEEDTRVHFTWEEARKRRTGDEIR